MNVLLLSQFLSTTKGGGEYVFMLIAKLLAESGNNVWIITSKMHGETYTPHKNVKIVFVPPLLDFKGGHPPNFKDNIIYSLCAVKKAVSIIKKERIDIIHSNNLAPALAGAVLSILTSKPHVATVFDVFSLFKDYVKLWRKQENVSKLNAFLLPIFERLIIRLKCSAIYTISEASKDDLIKIGANKPIYVIDCAIDIQEVENMVTAPCQFMYIGRLIFYKNLEVVIKALRIVKKSYPKVVLIIAGDGPQKNILEKLVSELSLNDSVQFKGYISEQEKKRLLCMSQAFIFPSLVEGFGLVILKAFACKKPVLVSNVRPSSDIVEDKITGFVVSPDDENKWAEAIEQIIKEPEKAHKMGNAGRNILEKKYNVQIMQNKILQMYREVIKPADEK